MGTDALMVVPDRPRDEHVSLSPEHALWVLRNFYECCIPDSSPKIVDEEFSDRTMAQVLRAPYRDSQEF